MTTTYTKCWNCTQPATHVMIREGSESLPACDNCTRIDRAEAERLGWTIAPISGAASVTGPCGYCYSQDGHHVQCPHF